MSGLSFEELREMSPQQLLDHLNREQTIRRDLTPIPMPPSALEALLTRLYVAEGCKITVATMQAKVQVAAYIDELRRDAR